MGFDQASTRPGMTWLAAVGRDRMRIIGILEILGAIGLILPAATALAVLMVLAIVLHARRPDEGRNIIHNVILGAIAALIAYGRFVVDPF